LLCSSLFAQPQPRNNKALIIDISGQNAEDHIKIVNNSNVDEFVVYAYFYEEKDDFWNFLGVTKVTGKDTTSEIANKVISLEDYKYIALESNQITNISYTLNCKNDDLYININDCTPTNKSLEKDIYKQYKDVFYYENASKDVLYESLLQKMVGMFGDSRAVIEYKDKALGIIKGRFSKKEMTFSRVPTYYYIVLTIEIRDGRYKITFNDFTKENGYGKSSVDEEGFPKLVETFNSIIKSLNTDLISNTTSDDDW
jgi:hypothetical protein